MTQSNSLRAKRNTLDLIQKFTEPLVNDELADEICEMKE